MRFQPGILLCVCACTAHDDAAIDDYIRSLPYLPVESSEVVPGATTAAARDGDYSCTTEDLRETRQYDRIVAYAANSDSLWPGALVAADSIVSGLFTQVAVPRQPLTFSVSLENLAGGKRATLEQPSLSSYREALANLLAAEITGATPANIYSEIEEVHSDQQLNMALGVQASWALGLASLKASFNWADSTTRSRYVVRYTQAYYTVDLDAPIAPSAMFAKELSLADVQTRFNAEHPPVYVSSVTYGRLIVFTFESAYSSTELGAALDFAYSGGVDVKGDVSVTYKDIISQSKITAYILGGDAGAAVKTIDSYDALIDFIKSGGNYSRESPGAPIAYKLSYLADNSPARMSFATDYQVKHCVRVAQKIKVTLKSIAVDEAADDNDNLEIFGAITASGTTNATLFTKSEANRITIHEGAQLGSLATPLGEAVIDVEPQPGKAIRIRANLSDWDQFFGNDALGDETLVNPFETGWRKDVTVLLTGDNSRVRVILSLAPI